jgi:hypothetical protein
MSKIKKILLSAHVMLLLAFVLAVPAFALTTHDQLDSGFVSIDGSRNFPVVDGAVSSFAFPSSSDSYSASSLVFYVPFSAPADTINCNISLFVSSDRLSSWSASIGYFYPTNTFVEQISSVSALSSQTNWVNTSRGILDSYSFSFDVSSISGADFVWYIRLVFDGTFDFVLGSDDSLLISPVHSSSSVSLSPSSSTLVVSNPATSLSLTQAGSARWKFGQAAYGYAVTSGSSAAVYSLFRVWDSGYVTLANINRLDSALPNTSISGIALSGTIPRSSSTVSIPEYSGTASNSSYSGSVSSVYSSLSPISLSAVVHSDDSEAVEQLQQINTTLDGMASNLQTITDDFTAREDVGNDIGGTTSDGQISAGTSGMSTGSLSLSDGIAGLPSFASIIAPTSGFIGFLTVPIQQIFAFGNGYLLYIATVMVLLSVVFWIIKRMGGDDG